MNATRDRLFAAAVLACLPGYAVGESITPGCEESKWYQSCIVQPGTSQIINPAEDKPIFITRLEIRGGGNIHLEYGAGPACSRGTEPLTNDFQIMGDGFWVGQGHDVILFVPVGNGLCVTTEWEAGLSVWFTHEKPTSAQ